MAEADKITETNEGNIKYVDAEPLINLLEEMGTNQEEFAAQSGISRSLISRMVTDSTPISLATAQKLEAISGKPWKYWDALNVKSKRFEATQGNRIVNPAKKNKTKDYKLNSLTEFALATIKNVDLAKVRTNEIGIRIGHFIRLSKIGVNSEPESITSSSVIDLPPNSILIVSILEIITPVQGYMFHCQLSPDLSNNQLDMNSVVISPEQQFRTATIKNLGTDTVQIIKEQEFAHLTVQKSVF